MPVSANYYVSAFAALRENAAEVGEIEEIVARRQEFNTTVAAQEEPPTDAVPEPDLCFCGEFHSGAEWEHCYCWQSGCDAEHGHLCGG